MWFKLQLITFVIQIIASHIVLCVFLLIPGRLLLQVSLMLVLVTFTFFKKKVKNILIKNQLWFCFIFALVKVIIAWWKQKVNSLIIQSSLRCHANNCDVSLQINVSNIVREMRLQRHGMIQTKVSVGIEVRVQREENRKPDVAFVSLLSGPVSLLLQSLAGGFTGHFTASRQPMATGKSAGPQSSLSLFHPSPWFGRWRSTQHCAVRGCTDEWLQIPGL